ncbi:MAG: hypothetical protein HC822_24765 [Oscillochloris sp.]|nr:hypothetical protein [Oscillochloris sp.]
MQNANSATQKAEPERGTLASVAAVYSPAALFSSAYPELWLGARSPFGLALPDAQPTPAQLYAPRGVYLDDQYLIVADSGNHRVMIWHGVPAADEQPADVVLGQPDFYSEGARAGGRGPERGLHLPTGVAVYEGRLLVADSWHHRVLIWNQVPQHSDVAPDLVIGQADLFSVSENRGRACDALTLYWPYGMGYVAGWFYITDTGNRRVLGWNGLPEPDQPPDLILGQPDACSRLENRGGDARGDSFRWPHAVAGDATRLLIADAGNHRVLGWAPRPEHDRPADLALGQPDLYSNGEFSYRPQGPQRLRFPYAISYEAGLLAVADTANNRVLLWRDPPQSGAFHPADAVLSQPSFDVTGENRWKLVERDTLCWPYGIHLHRNRLAIADSGNNRVMVWQLEV